MQIALPLLDLGWPAAPKGRGGFGMRPDGGDSCGRYAWQTETLGGASDIHFNHLIPMTQKPNNPRILLHGLSAGGITKADIERRARELALIRGGSENYTEEDLLLARRELLGADAPETTTDDTRSTAAQSRDPSEPVSEPGRQAHEEESPDENTMAERLALEGVDEAQHDQMLEARRKRNQDSGSEET